MNDQNTIIELSKMSLGAFIKKLNSMTSEEQKELLNNPYLDELNPVIFSSFFLQLQPEEAKQILNNPKIEILTMVEVRKKIKCELQLRR